MLKLNKGGWIVLIVLIVGGLNWGLVGLFDFDRVAVIFGDMTRLSGIVYCLVGVATLYTIFGGLLTCRIKWVKTHTPHTCNERNRYLTSGARYAEMRLQSSALEGSPEEENFKGFHFLSTGGKCMKRPTICVLMLTAAVVVTALTPAPAQARVSGAIFTTLVDGTRVNANIYESREDVYLDGGPGPNAPIGAAGLDEGCYYFQATGPTGKVLLSTDAVECRQIHVDSNGVIDNVCPATRLKKVKGKWIEVECTHATGFDVDHNAITVQLMPYKKTPNKGGVYKVWVTPIDRFVGDPEQVDNPDYFHGFVPAWSKTDNYKVNAGKPYIMPVIVVRKFHDSNANGVWDDDELEITSWIVDVLDPLGVPDILYTPDQIAAMPAGIWTFTEDLVDGWMQTALYVDGVAQIISTVASVEVFGESGEVHEVVFGNIQLASVRAVKYYDRNANGVNDNDEPPVAGIRFTLEGTNILGNEVHLEGVTDANGVVIFEDLLPGDYVLTEVVPDNYNWQATTETVVTVALAEGDESTYEFGNICTGVADFDTKGYWHNKNGLAETTLADFAYLNSWLPYQEPSSYFGAGDEPIDGFFEDGTTPVPEARNVAGESIAGAGTPWAEQSHFLNDNNGTGDRCEQLAQQLDAFIMNTRHRLDGDSAIQLPDGSWIVASEMIADAILVWQIGTDAEKTAMIRLLDELNNSDTVEYVYDDPCPVDYNL